MFSKKGFTLVELLVVISIISVLAVIGISVYTSVQRGARDGKRESDLRTIQTALEQYYADQRFYPTAISAGGAAFTSSTGNQASPLPSPLKTYIRETPSDPLPSPRAQYRYISTPVSPVCDNSSTSTNKCSGYCIYANMENLTTSSIPAFCPSPAPTGYNFGLTVP